MPITLTDPQAWAIGTDLVLMVLDVVVGFSQSLITGTFSSSKMRVGLGHKFVTVCIIALALILETAGSHVTGLPFSGATTVAVCIYVAVMEVGSILENAAEAYPDLKGSKLLALFDTDEKGE